MANVEHLDHQATAKELSSEAAKILRSATNPTAANTADIWAEPATRAGLSDSQRRLAALLRHAAALIKEADQDRRKSERAQRSAERRAQRRALKAQDEAREARQAARDARKPNPLRLV